MYHAESRRQSEPEEEARGSQGCLEKARLAQLPGSQPVALRLPYRGDLLPQPQPGQPRQGVFQQSGDWHVGTGWLGRRCRGLAWTHQSMNTILWPFLHSGPEEDFQGVRPRSFEAEGILGGGSCSNATLSHPSWGSRRGNLPYFFCLLPASQETKVSRDPKDNQ